MKINRILLFILFVYIMFGNLNDVDSKNNDNNIQQSSQNNPYGISEDQVNWMREATIKQLKGSRVKGAGDTWIYTPDGVGNYKALWTRDSYYMVEYAGDLMDPDEIKSSIYYLLFTKRPA